MNGRGRGGEEGKYLTGALNLTSKMVFQLDEGAEILGSLSQADYPIVPALPGYGITRDTPVPQQNLVCTVGCFFWGKVRVRVRVRVCARACVCMCVCVCVGGGGFALLY